MQQGLSSIHKNREFLGIDRPVFLGWLRSEPFEPITITLVYWGDTAASIRFLRLGWQCLGYHDYPWLFMTHEGGRIRTTNPSGQSAPIDYAGPRPPTMDRWRRQQKGEDFPVWGRWNGIDEILLRMVFQVCKGIRSSLRATQLESHLLMLRQFQPSSSACIKALPPSRARYSIKFQAIMSVAGACAADCWCFSRHGIWPWQTPVTRQHVVGSHHLRNVSILGTRYPILSRQPPVLLISR